MPRLATADQQALTCADVHIHGIILMKKPSPGSRWWLLVLGVSAATGIGFLAQEIAAWFSEFLFSWDWSRSPRLASAEAAERHD